MIYLFSAIAAGLLGWSAVAVGVAVVLGRMIAKRDAQVSVDARPAVDAQPMAPAQPTVPGRHPTRRPPPRGPSSPVAPSAGVATWLDDARRSG